jgi:hypothetical protein
MFKQVFDDNGYIIIPKLIPSEFCYFFTHALLRQQYIQETQGDSQVPRAKAILNHELMFETLQEILWPEIESIIDDELLPTYSYARLYSNGDDLEPHTDRPACEISATIQLGRSHHYAWPIYVGNTRIDLGEGDAIIYKGCEVEHYRKACEGPENYYSGQVFIHFVKKNGEFSEHFKDTINSDNQEERNKVDFTKNRTYLMEVK